MSEALKDLIQMEQDRHNCFVDECTRLLHMHYINGLITAYEVVLNGY